MKRRVPVHYPYLLEVVKPLAAEEKVVAVCDAVAQGRRGKIYITTYSEAGNFAKGLAFGFI